MKRKKSRVKYDVDAHNWKQEFERLFVHKGEDGDDPPAQWAWTIRGSYPIEIEAFIGDLLESVPTLQLFKSMADKVEDGDVSIESLCDDSGAPQGGQEGKP